MIIKLSEKFSFFFDNVSVVPATVTCTMSLSFAQFNLK